MKYDKFDKLIYRAMIELGWIIATTEEEVEWFDEANKDFEPPLIDYDEILRNIHEKIRIGEKKRNNISQIYQLKIKILFFE